MVTRFSQFRAHMVGNNIRWQHISDELGIAPNSCLLACQRETIRPEFHKKLLALGFAENLLPIPSNRMLNPYHASQLSQLAN